MLAAGRGAGYWLNCTAKRPKRLLLFVVAISLAQREKNSMMLKKEKKIAKRFYIYSEDKNPNLILQLHFRCLSSISSTPLQTSPSDSQTENLSYKFTAVFHFLMQKRCVPHFGKKT